MTARGRERLALAGKAGAPKGHGARCGKGGLRRGRGV